MIKGDFFDNQHIFLFGTSQIGILTYRYLSSKAINVDGFLDNDIHKQGGKCLECMVYSPEHVLSITGNFVIIVCSDAHNEEIRNQLLKKGVGGDAIISYSELTERYVNDTIDSCLNDIRRQKCGNIQASNSIRLLYDGQIYSLQKRGGISRYNFEVITGCAKMPGIDVSFFQGFTDTETCFAPYVHSFSNFFSWKGSPGYVESHRIRDTLNRRLIEYYTNNEMRFDIYHPTYYEDMGITNYKNLIVTVHDMIQEIFGLDEHMRNCKRNIIEKADGIIAVSENTKRDLVRIMSIPESKIQVIHEANSLTIEAGKERVIKEPYILYVGDRRAEYKNFKLMISAVSKCAHVNELKIICFGGGEFTKEEMNFIDKAGLGKRILQLGGDDGVLANLYYYADVFIYPSAYEGFGLPILEAMHYGTPVITANVSSLPEVAGDAAVYFDPTSEESLTHAINELLDDSVLRRQLKQLGLKREKLFSWRTCCQETANYYRQFS